MRSDEAMNRALRNVGLQFIDDMETALAVIASLRASGYRVVPEKPTQRMVEAAKAGYGVEGQWFAMLAAAEEEDG